MKKQSSLFESKIESKTQPVYVIAKQKSTRVFAVLANHILTNPTKINERTYEDIQATNEFIANHANADTLKHHTRALLCFIQLSTDTNNEGVVLTLFRDFIALCPQGIMETIITQIQNLNAHATHSNTLN
jgi:hypothetical protein